MNWLVLTLNEARRRPLRTSVAAAGVALAVVAMFSLLSFHNGYREGIRREIERLGAHILVVPKGCPYDSASMALHGASWPCYLNADYLAQVRGVQGIDSAAPAFMAAATGTNGVQTVYVGINEQMLALRTGWKINGAFPHASAEILVGAEAARVQGWKVGQSVTLPELAGRRALVIGILQPTQSAEDAFIYPRLADAQQWFQKPGRLTHILVKLKDPNLLDSAVGGLRGCDAGMDMNVVPLAHLFRTIQSLVSATGLLLGCVALISLLIVITGVSNALLMSVSERTGEIGVMRAIGASPGDVVRLIFMETIQLCLAGGVAGVLIAFASSRAIEAWLRLRLPFAPSDPLIRWDWGVVGASLATALVLGSVAALLPAWRAAKLSPSDAMRARAKA